jgi:hypothetical protein
MKILNYFNLRTFLAVSISQIAAFVAIHYEIKFNLNLMLFGLAVVFPLHFSIQAAFKRREKALEYLSGFKAGLMALYYYFQIAKDLPLERKTQGVNLLKFTADQLVHQLEKQEWSYELFQRKMNEIFSFIETNREQLVKRHINKMIRHLSGVQESSVYLLSLSTHRTMVGMRFYSVFFIFIFPLVYVPILLHRLDEIVPYWTIQLFAGFTTLILVTLTNFQKMIEYPFDPGGMDNIRLKEFKLDI